jgi:alcohol dehydrogenase class IV
MRYLLPSADPADEEARAEMQIAAWLAVAGYPNQMAGVGHAIGHQLGGLCAVPHGIGACCILPHAMEFNQAAAAGRFELMGEELGSEPIEAVRHLITATGLPSRLRDVGVPADRLEEIAAASFDDEAIVGNPRTVRSPQEILDEILVRAW